MHVEPFQISGFTFTHVEEGDALNRPARDRWTALHDVATEVWRSEEYVPCEVSEGETVFAVTDQGGDLFGCVALYRERVLPDGRHSALVAPMWPEIETEVPGEAYAPNGEVINLEEIELATQSAEAFWWRTFAFIEHLTMHGLVLEDGEVVAYQIRFPNSEDGDPAQHEWRNVREKFDIHSKLEADFKDSKAIKMTTVWKSQDPAPDRARGAFYA